MAGLTGNTFFEGPSGRIEAILKEAKEPSNRVAVICHPHPLHGGTMHNKVVFRIARAFNDCGFAVLRFNFRGVGESAGTHDFGNGEQDDLLAAISFAEERFPGSELWLAGFSFGSSVMIRVACRVPRANGIVAAGFPVSMYDFTEVIDCRLPKLFVQGEFDQFGPPEKLRAFFDRLPDPKKLEVISGADHFFEGHLDELQRAVISFIISSIAVGPDND